MQRRELAAYFILTFLISWSIEIPLALSAQGRLSFAVPFWLHYLASFGPLLAACILTVAAHGVSGLGPLLAGLGRWRIGRSYASFVLFPIPVFASIVIVTRVVNGSWPDLGLLGQADYLPRIGIIPALLLWTLTYGLGEEVGWRGFALPRLQANRSALAASLGLGAFWAVWHVPAIFYRATYIQMGLLVVPMLLTVAAVGSVTYTWLFNGTRGSLLALVVFHGLFDFFSVWPAGVIAPGMVMTVLMVFWAVRVYKLHGAETLSPEGRVVV